MSEGKIAVVGGGPSGALVAAELARADRDVILFDEKLAWEKPCGGGVTQKALERWPFLLEGRAERNYISSCQLISPLGRSVVFDLDRPVAVFSRAVLNQLLLDRAQDAGAHLIRERVLTINGTAGKWQLETGTASHTADFIVLAAGARNSFRKQFAGALGPENFMVAAGYYIPGSHQTIHVKFLPGLHGYIWIFPRADHLSVGICGRMKDGNTAKLRHTLEASLPEFGLNVQGSQFYAHIIPSYTAATLSSARFCGPGWALVGDAAGFVDAVTGEGIFYALQSAELLAQAILTDAAESYTSVVHRYVLPELERAARIADRFYSGEWLGAPVIERMIQFTTSSSHFRTLMRDLFAGCQEYSSLKRRIYSSVPRIATEALLSWLWPGGQLRAHASWK